jgi:hypothetical protein
MKKSGFEPCAGNFFVPCYIVFTYEDNMQEAAMDDEQIMKQLHEITAEAEALVPYLEGNLLGGKRATYTKKDGSVSCYATAPVVQYRVGRGKRASKRVPIDRIECVKRLLDAGKRRRELLEQHRELSAKLARAFKKNS